jgi:hypothetical protein
LLRSSLSEFGAYDGGIPRRGVQRGENYNPVPIARPGRLLEIIGYARKLIET